MNPTKAALYFSIAFLTTLTTASIGDVLSGGKVAIGHLLAASLLNGLIALKALGSTPDNHKDTPDAPAA